MTFTAARRSTSLLDDIARHAMASMASLSPHIAVCIVFIATNEQRKEHAAAPRITSSCSSPSFKTVSALTFCSNETWLIAAPKPTCASSSSAVTGGSARGGSPKITSDVTISTARCTQLSQLVAMATTLRPLVDPEQRLANRSKAELSSSRHVGDSFLLVES